VSHSNATSNAFDPEHLRLDEPGLKNLSKTRRARPPRPRNGRKFLKGPIPWDWLVRACRLPGRALHVALFLWFEAGCSKSATIRFRLSQVTFLGMHRDTAKRGLRALANARLIAVDCRPGRCLEVTLLDDGVPE
jgi:hypothetical protein